MTEGIARRRTGPQCPVVLRRFPLRLPLPALLLTLALGLVPGGAPQAQDASRPRDAGRTGAAARPDTLASLAAGGEATCLTTTAGAGYCWGAPDSEDGHAHRVRGPDGRPARLRALATSSLSRCGLTSDGDVWCTSATDGWVDSTVNREPLPADCRGYICLAPLPARGSLPPGPLRSVAVGDLHACALAPNGSAHCWGRNDMGMLGNGVWAADSTGTVGEISRVPTMVVGGHRFIQISGAGELTCGLTTPERHIYCWGYGQNGETGDSSIMTGCSGPLPYANKPCSTPVPARVFPESLPGDFDRPNELKFVRVTAGNRMACAIAVSGEAYCWGGNYRCQLGRCRSAESARAHRIAVPGRVVDIAPGAMHACARTADWRVFCWGNNTAGQLGSLATVNAGADGAPPDYRDTTDSDVVGAAYRDPCFNGGRCSPAPVEVSPGRRWAALAAGSDHACALARDDGGIYCWGGSNSAVLGANARFVLCENRSAMWKDAPCQPTPVRIPGFPPLAAPAVEVLAKPEHERAREVVRTLRSTRVLVSAREVRVIFPPDTSSELGWPAAETPGYRARYYWGVFIDGIDGPRGLELRLGPGGTSARTFPSLRSVVAAASPGLCTSGMVAQCTPDGVAASVEGSRVVLTLRDPPTITRLFGLRQDSVQVSRAHPGDATYLPPVRVPVEYVAPEIPIPDSAFRAEAVRARRRYRARITTITRGISGGSFGSPAIWIGVGDSIPVYVSEMTCTHDACGGSAARVTGTAWSVDDTAVVRLRVVSPSDSRRSFEMPSPEAYLVARARGRTRVRATIPPSPSDTMPSREPPPRTLEREVVVISRAVRLATGSRPDTIRVGDTLSLRPQVFDADGVAIDGAPIELRYSDGDVNRLLTTTDTARIAFEHAGQRTIVARFGILTDTVRVSVVAEGKR